MSSSPASVCRRGSTTWASGSPKRTLYSTSFGPVGREHQPRVEHAAVVDAEAGEMLERRRHERAHQLVDPAFGDRHRRVRAHAAGVEAGVAVADALEVLRRCERASAVGIAVAHRRAATARGRPSPPRSRACGRRRRTRRPTGTSAPCRARRGSGRRRTHPCPRRGRRSSRRRARASTPGRRGRPPRHRHRTWRGARSGCRRPAPPASSTPWSPRGARRRHPGRTPGCPRARTASAAPLTSWRSAAGTTRSTARSRASAATAAGSLGSSGWHVAVGRDAGVARAPRAPR